MKAILVQVTPVPRKFGSGALVVWCWSVAVDSGTRMLPPDLEAQGESSSADTAMAEASAHVVRLAGDLDALKTATD